jgi:hypothetical protein
MTSVARENSVSFAALHEWINLNSERSARVNAVRQLMAHYWQEKAESVLESAPDEFELKRAKELAHHYRWRASKIAPKDYGDRVAVEHGGGISLTDVPLTDAQRAALDKAIEQDV